MIRKLENWLIGRQKAQLNQRSCQYEVERFVAAKRRSQLTDHSKNLLRRKSVLAMIFAAGTVKEVVKQHSNEKSSGSHSKQATQLAMFLARLF